MPVFLFAGAYAAPGDSPGALSAVSRLKSLCLLRLFAAMPFPLSAFQPAWTALVQPMLYIAGMNAARYFMRREDDQPPQTPADSPFRNFNVSCRKCGSFKLQLYSQFDEQAGKMALVLFCPRCRQQEIMPVK